MGNDLHCNRSEAFRSRGIRIDLLYQRKQVWLTAFFDNLILREVVEVHGLHFDFSSRSDKKAGRSPLSSDMSSKRDPQALAIVATAIVVFAPAVMVDRAVLVIGAFKVMMSYPVVITVEFYAQCRGIFVLGALVPAITIGVADRSSTCGR